MDKVKTFYRNTPFNFTEDTDFYLQSIKESNQILEYYDLHKILLKREGILRRPNVEKVIEFGCGTGWLTNTLAYYYKKEVKSVDFTKKAIQIARQVSNKLSLKTEYVVSDIFDYQDQDMYDLVISMGVLHHTRDCKEAFRKISTYVKPGGLIYIGLYHLYGRRPMLKMLQEYAYWHGETSAYNLFQSMNTTMSNKEHSFSWFRDQVIHPHETQHTLKEVSEWINEISFELISTSINNYKPIANYSESELNALEKDMEVYSYRQNIENRSFSPGYFTVCARKSID